MLKKILLTIIVIFLPVAGFAALVSGIESIGDSVTFGECVLTIFGFILMIIPGWMMWKGTKIIPILSNVIVRIISLILGIIFFPLGIFFSLWGIWVKS